MRRRYLAFLISLLTLASCIPFADHSRQFPSIESQAEEVIDRLQGEDYVGVASLIHEPPYYSQEDSERDRNSLALAMKALFAELGTVGSTVDRERRLAFHFLGLAGGDLNYWRNQSNIRMLPPRLYETEFSRAGSGLIQLQYGYAEERVELCSIAVGIPAETRGAKETLFIAARALIKIQNPERDESEINALAERLIHLSK